MFFKIKRIFNQVDYNRQIFIIEFSFLAIKLVSIPSKNIYIDADGIAKISTFAILDFTHSFVLKPLSGK